MSSAGASTVGVAPVLTAKDTAPHEASAAQFDPLMEAVVWTDDFEQVIEWSLGYATLRAAQTSAAIV